MKSIQLLLVAMLARTASVLAFSSQLDVGLETAAEMQVETYGVENCFNKCEKMFNRLTYSITVQLGEDTYEYSACRAGCTICQQILASDPPEQDPYTCTKVCKNTNWLQNVDINGNPFPIFKGVVEPDKACTFGCIINTCQSVCTGGTTANKQTAANAQYFWPNGGCSIKTGAVRPGGYYSQNAQYNLWNAPGGAGAVNGCCANALSLCEYTGPRNTQNYRDVLSQAQRLCKGSSAGNTHASICAYFANPANCGIPLE